jgi:hypothetical protein
MMLPALRLTTVAVMAPAPSEAMKAAVSATYAAGGAIGGAVARAFAREGARLQLTGRDVAKVDVGENGTAGLISLDASSVSANIAGGRPRRRGHVSAEREGKRKCHRWTPAVVNVHSGVGA